MPRLLRVRNVRVMEEHVHGQLLVLGVLLVRAVVRHEGSLFQKINGLVMSSHVRGKNGSNDDVSRNPTILRRHVSQDVTRGFFHDLQSRGGMEVFQDCLV